VLTPARIVLIVAVGALVAPADGAGFLHVSRPRARYDAALAALRHTKSFRFTEWIAITGPPKHSVRSDVRFSAPNRIRMLVQALAPPPRAALASVQVGRITCQQPPGTCYRGARADPAQTIRALVQPRGAISYRLEAGASGTEVITLSTALGGIRYFGRLTIRRDGLPQKFASTVVRGGTVVAVQKGTFTYGGRYTITLPPQGLRLRR
jgi:hypothetical protein